MRSFQTLLGWALLLALVAAGGALILRPDPRDALRAADQLFADGHYHSALQAYRAIDAAALPEAALRLGAVRAIRGENSSAERALRAAMLAGLRPADYQLALLYLGQVLAHDGRAALAEKTWALADDCRSVAACAYRPPARALRAELALRQGDYAAAEAGYRAALAEALPADWAGLARDRLALLLAARDPDAARAVVGTAGGQAPPADPFLSPLLPADSAWRGQLAAALAADPALRPQLLGQIYLSQGIYGLAEAQFASVDPHGPDAQSAAVYAAYTRWRAGDRAAGLDRLAQFVRDRPEDPQARTLLALAYLADDKGDAAYAQIDAIGSAGPSAPDVHLVWASWYAARQEYPQASQEYSLAVAQAPPDRRGPYALLGARFHLSTTYDLCEGGLPLAEAAAAALPASGDAWATLAAHQYYCGRLGAALASAERAAAGDGGPAGAYYLGATLAALGQPERARNALIRAADLAPASVWRERAEKALALMP